MLACHRGGAGKGDGAGPRPGGAAPGDVVFIRPMAVIIRDIYTEAGQELILGPADAGAFLA